jgi:C4-dicarboxylate-specific signal transduction histidine kinase
VNTSISAIHDSAVTGLLPSIESVPQRQSDDAAEAGWLRILEGLIAGIHHALNNRLGTLSAVSQVLEGDLPPGHPLAGSLSAEVRRMEDTVAWLRELGPGNDEVTAVQLEPILERAIQFVSLHPATRDVSVEVRLAEGLLPLRLSPGRLFRVLLILLAAAARTGAGPIRVRASSDDRSLEVSIRADGAVESEAEGTEMGGIDPAAAAALVGADEGDLRIESDPEGLTCFLRYPTLLEVRRRERVS